MPFETDTAMRDHFSPVDEGYSALDMATAQAVAYVRDAQWTTIPGHSNRPDGDAARRTLIAVDSACDMPQSWLDYHGIVVSQRRLKLPSGTEQETRASSALVDQFQRLDRLAQVVGQTSPAKPVEMRDVMQRQIRSGTQGALFIATSARQSKVFSYALAAMQSLVLIHGKVRRVIDPSSPPLRGWVIDSANALTGVGILVAEAVRLRSLGHPAASIAAQLREFRSAIHTLAVPGHFGYLARTATSLEGHTIPLWKRRLAQWFDLMPTLHLSDDKVRAITRHRGRAEACNALLRRLDQLLEHEPLATPTLAISYAGPIEAIEDLPAFETLRARCNRQHVTLVLSPMSVTGALMLGPKALSVSFASHTWSG